MKYFIKRKKKIQMFFLIFFPLFIIFYFIFGDKTALGNFFISENIPEYYLYTNSENSLPEKIDVFNESYEVTDVAGKNEVSFFEAGQNTNTSQKIDVSKIKSIAELKKNYYIVDKKTLMTSDYFNVDKFLKANLKINKNGNFPKVLIFHTHSHEMFKDSNQNNLYDGVVGAGERLKQRLEEKGIKCIHCTDRFDVVDGNVKILGAYERMENPIRKILSDNPSIEVVIDMHRDGIDESKKLVQTINGKPTAKIMFFNGICRILKDGKLVETEGLSNPYVPTNLAFSFNMNLVANEMFPGLSRGIYLNAYRYSLHLIPKSSLIEVGAQNNTKEEIFNAVDLLAEVMAKVLG